MRKYGNLANFDGCICEKNLKKTTKNPGRNTQGRSNVLAQQSCERYYESVIIDMMVSELKISNKWVGGDDNLDEDETYEFLEDADDASHNNHPKAHSKGEYKIEFELANYEQQEYNVKGYHSSYKKIENIWHDDKLLLDIFERLRGKEYGVTSNFISCFKVLHLQLCMDTNNITNNESRRKILTLRADTN